MSQPFPAPAGYGEVVALDRLKHSGLGLAPDRYSWCAQLNAVPLHAQEIAKAGLHHPVAFAKNQGGGLLPVAILGLRDGENLSVSQQQWHPERYQPAYIRRYPFSLARTSTSNSGASLITVAEAGLAPGPVPLFVNGQAQASWQPVQTLLNAHEAAQAQTEAFMALLDQLTLLQPFEALALPKAAAPMQLRGLWRIDETRLSQAPEGAVQQMMQRGELRAIYAHLNSLEIFARLMSQSAASPL